MSVDALIYVKTLHTAPNGEPVTLAEKAILWWLADGHSEKPLGDNPSGCERAAWYAVSTLAAGNGISQRRTNEILQALIRKRVIWREPRSRKNGSDSSNYWRFTVLDGEPTQAAIRAEEERRVRGEMAADQTNRLKYSKKLRLQVSPQSDTICTESPQTTTAEDRHPGCGCPPSPSAEDGSARVREVAVSRRGSPQSSAAEDRRPRALTLSSSGTFPELPEGVPNEPSTVLAAAAEFCGNPCERERLKLLWSETIGKLQQLRVMPTNLWQHLSNATFQRQSATDWLGDRWLVRVSVRDRAHVNFCERYRDEIEKAMELVGYPRERIALEFRVEQEASLPI